jgi:hypothetical protein
MCHLLTNQRSAEVLGDDATEGVEDLLALFAGQG